MPGTLEIRASLADDVSSIAGLMAEAFPDEDLLPLVRELLALPSGQLSLIAIRDGALVGSVLFTMGKVSGFDARVALLGPLAVAASARNSGVGRALVEAGLDRLSRDGVACVLLLGAPAYYGRLGFVPELAIQPPFPLIPEWRQAWQSVRLASSGPIARGLLALPAPWMRPSLWSP
ncbi:MAG: GNAT family N-acetyltransferase [Hyphomicrobiaceae bacterium]